MAQRCALLVLALCLLPFVAAQDGKYTIKTAASPAPKELAADIQKLLGTTSIQLLDPSGKTIGEFWFRSAIPADATPEQIKNGLTYREVRQSEILGAVRFEQDWTDYRKQKVKAGVYTLRLGYQPADGDHQGSSDFQDFLLVLAADKDKSPALMEFKQLAETSAKSIGSGHPGVFMLFPNSQPDAAPAVAARPKDHWTINTKGDVVVGGKKVGADLGISLTIVGHAE
jgi:hypothetical protein